MDGGAREDVGAEAGTLVLVPCLRAVALLADADTAAKGGIPDEVRVARGLSGALAATGGGIQDEGCDTVGSGQFALAPAEVGIPEVVAVALLGEADASAERGVPGEAIGAGSRLDTLALASLGIPG